MARPLRIELAGGLYHVTSCGDRRETIYFDDEDRLAWLEGLSEVCDGFNWRCHAFCQMTNYYYLVVETPDGNVSRGMRQLNGGVYTMKQIAEYFGVHYATVSRAIRRQER